MALSTKSPSRMRCLIVLLMDLAQKILKIIEYVVKDANVFVISHKTDLNRFDNVMRFEKVKGFSRMI